MEGIKYMKTITNIIYATLALLCIGWLAVPRTTEAASNTDTQPGTQALSSKQLSGVNDTALGYQALKSNTSGNSNTATGSQATAEQYNRRQQHG